MSKTKRFLYGEVNFPPIPKEMLEFTTPVIIKKDNKDIGYGIEHKKQDRILKSCGYANSVSTHEPLLMWLYNNKIPGGKNQKEIVIQTQTAYAGILSTHIVHSDISRTFALNYIIDPGGTDVITSWYQENNMPLHRIKTSGWKQADTGIVKYDDLKLLGSVRFEKHKWYLIATDILHDVDNITGSRSSITFSFDNDSVLKVLEKMQLIKNIKD
jgi:hypothetical protein